MEITETLAKVRELAAALTPVADMAVLLGLSEFELRTILADDNEVSRAYRLERAKAALAVRKRDIELAEAGSPSACAAVAGYYAKLIADD